MLCFFFNDATVKWYSVQQKLFHFACACRCTYHSQSKLSKAPSLDSRYLHLQMYKNYNFMYSRLLVIWLNIIISLSKLSSSYLHALCDYTVISHFSIRDYWIYPAKDNICGGMIYIGICVRVVVKY